MTLLSPNKGYPLTALDGDSGSMADCHDSLTRLHDQLSDLSETVQAFDDLPGVGKAIESLRQDAQELTGALDPNAQEARLLGQVMKQYSDDYDNYAVRANGMISDIEEAHARWQQLSQEAQEAGEAALTAAQGDDDAAYDSAMAESDEACAARDRAKKDLDSLWEEYEGYYSQWDNAYDEALTQLATGAENDLSRSAKKGLTELLAADTPEEVAKAWKDLDPADRKELEKSHPDIIGNLDGVPYDVRARVNKGRLERLVCAVDIDEETREELLALYETMRSGTPPPQLVSFDPDGSDQVTAAFAYGDLDSATNINVLVPGMDSTVKGMSSWGTSAQDINDDVPDSATVTWFGYDSPGKTEEPGMGKAEDGAPALGGFLDGIDTLSPSAQTSVVAHSYGSTMAAQAIGSQPGGHGVDNFITVGSAGLPDDDAIHKNLQTGPRMFSTVAPSDMWSPIGKIVTFEHNTSPTDIDGTVSFDSDGGVDSDGGELAETPGHSAQKGKNGLPWQSDDGDGYLVPGTESLYNVKHIIATGDPGTDPGGEGSGGFIDSVLHYTPIPYLW